MAFVKLDCGMLDSTIWIDRDARELFITALLMAEPRELAEPAKQIEVRTLNETGFIVPPGWYGFVPAAGIGIIRRAGMEPEKGFAALERLGNPENDSRTPDFEGRRLVRIDGGYIALNFDKYRQKDHTSSERSRRYRERRRQPFLDQVLKRDGYRCGICGGAIDSTDAIESHLDHIVPLNCDGVSGDIRNYQLAHAKCNNGKSGNPDSVTWRHPSMSPAGLSVTALRATATPLRTQAEAEAEAEGISRRHKQKEEERQSPPAPDAPLPPSSGLKEVFDAWNANPLFPGCLVLSDKRRRFLQVRLHDAFFEANWKAALAKLAASKFCLGNNDRGWRANFDWFIQPDSVAKIMEGKYENSGSTRSNGSGNSANRNTGTLNEGKASQYRGVGKVV